MQHARLDVSQPSDKHRACSSGHGMGSEHRRHLWVLRRLHNKEEGNLGPNCKTRTVAESILAENTHLSPWKELAGLVQVRAVWTTRGLSVQTGNELSSRFEQLHKSS